MKPLNSGKKKIGAGRLMLKWAGGMKLDNEQLCQEIKEKMDEVRADSILNEREKRTRIIMLATKLG